MAQPRALLLLQAGGHATATSSIGGADVEMSTFGRATQFRSVIEKKIKTCSSRWIISCTPQCVAVARDRLPNIEAGGQTGGPPGGATAPRTEAGGQTTTPGGPTASRRRAAAQPCTPPAVAVVEAVVMARRTTANSRCSMRCEQRTTSPHHRQVGTSNLLLHDDARATNAAGSIGSTAKQGCGPRWSRDRSPRGWCSRRQRKTSKIEKTLSSDYHVRGIDFV
jgi:hypothetical protein